MVGGHTVLFSTEVISETVRDLAASIDRDLAGSRLVVITVLKGAVMFACDLVRAMETETEMVFLSASSYSGLEIDEEFIYGYGLDWDERYRDLPFIALANP